MGYFSMAATVSMGVAPAVGLAIIGGGSFTSLFALSAALGALAFLSTRLVTYPKVERGGERRGILSMLVAREAVRPAVTAFFATMTYGAILACYLRILGEISPSFIVPAIADNSRTEPPWVHWRLICLSPSSSTRRC